MFGLRKFVNPIFSKPCVTNTKFCRPLVGWDHRYIIEQISLWANFMATKLKDKKYTINAPSFFITLNINRLMHQLFHICWQMVSCWFMLLMLFIPLLYICGFYVILLPLGLHQKLNLKVDSKAHNLLTPGIIFAGTPH